MFKGSRIAIAFVAGVLSGIGVVLILEKASSGPETHEREAQPLATPANASFAIRAGAGEVQVKSNNKASSSISSSTQVPASVEIDSPVISRSPAIPVGSHNASTQSQSPALSGLLNSYSIDCTFDVGAGGNWSNGSVQAHTAAWQGGLITFQSIDIDAGTAEMIGSAGATGSLEGKTDARVTAADTGLHFMAITPHMSKLVVTTVYSSYDDSGNYRAVMSRHGLQFANESAQFYGTCYTRIAK